MKIRVNYAESHNSPSWATCENTTQSQVHKSATLANCEKASKYQYFHTSRPHKIKLVRQLHTEHKKTHSRKYESVFSYVHFLFGDSKISPS